MPDLLKLCAASSLALLAAACAHAPEAASESEALCRGRSGAYEQVLAACDEALAGPRRPDAEQASLLYSRALTLTNMRHLDRAIADLDASIALAPNVATAHRLRGYAYWRKRELTPALESIETALRVDPNLAMGYYNRGLIYNAMNGDVARATAEIGRAHALEPENPVFLTGLCSIRAQAGVDLDVAMSDCNRSLALRPRHSDTLEFRALIFARRGEWQAALTDYDAALALESDLASAQYGRGLTLLHLGEAEAGRAHMLAALAVDGEANEAYRDLPGAITR